MLKYLKFQLICDMTFGAFMITWFITRHVLYFMILWSLWVDCPQEIDYGCYYGPNSNLHGPVETPDRFGHLLQPFTDPQGLVCWTPRIMGSFMITLLALQVILMIWFVMICRVAVKVIKGGVAEDSRSDDEGEDDEEEFEMPEKCGTGRLSPRQMPLEEEVSIDSINLCCDRGASRGKRFRKSGGAASGITIPSDTKDLLGRIGCDKGVS